VIDGRQLGCRAFGEMALLALAGFAQVQEVGGIMDYASAANRCGAQ